MLRLRQSTGRCTAHGANLRAIPSDHRLQWSAGQIDTGRDVTGNRVGDGAGIDRCDSPGIYIGNGGRHQQQRRAPYLISFHCDIRLPPQDSVHRRHPLPATNHNGSCSDAAHWPDCGCCCAALPMFCNIVPNCCIALPASCRLP